MALARFTLNGTRYEVSSDVAQSRLDGVVPEAIREHAVQVNGVWYPVKQAFEVAVGVPRAEFISHTARRHLAALGFPLKGEIESRDGDAPCHDRFTVTAGSESGPGNLRVCPEFG